MWSAVASSYRFATRGSKQHARPAMHAAGTRAAETRTLLARSRLKSGGPATALHMRCSAILQGTISTSLRRDFGR